MSTGLETGGLVSRAPLPLCIFTPTFITKGSHLGPTGAQIVQCRVKWDI